jgi:hypothetical protein
VALFDGSNLQPGPPPVKFVGDFFVFEQTLRNGVFLTSGDVNGDGVADLVFGGGPGGGPRVMVLSGALATVDPASALAAPVANFFAGDPDTRAGVHVGIVRADADEKADLVTGGGTGISPQVSVYTAAGIIGVASPQPLRTDDLFDANVLSGAFVG